MAAAAPSHDPLESPDHYRKHRRALIRFFRSHGAGDPEDLADETVSRVVRKVATGSEIEDLPSYLHAVAKNVLSEAQRERIQDALIRRSIRPGPSAESELARSLEDCLNELKPEERALILAYYTGDRGEKITRRQRLAVELSLSMETLRTRACRIRARVEKCVEARLRKLS